MWAPGTIRPRRVCRVFEQIINLQPVKRSTIKAGNGRDDCILLLQSAQKLRIIFGKVQTYNVNGMLLQTQDSSTPENQLQCCNPEARRADPKPLRVIVIVNARWLRPSHALRASKSAGLRAPS